MITEEQKQDGKKKLFKEVVKKYHQIYNGAWNNLDFTKDTKRTMLGCGLILILGAVGSYTIINKK